jgi:predicted dehydrogenase
MPLRLAVIGVGHMGRIHLEKLKSFEGVEVTCIVDLKQSRAKEISERYNTPFFTQCTDHLADIDAAVIASPTETHHDIAKTYLNNGVHVFIEKPITTTPEEAGDLIELARKNNLVLQVGHLERFNPAFEKAFPSIKHPVYIEAARLSPFTGRSTDVDVILDLMIHDIDLLLSLVKDEVKDIRAHGVTLVTSQFDAVSAWIEFAGGCVAHLAASRVSTRRERHLLVCEKERHFFIDLLHGKLTAKVKDSKGEISNIEFTAETLDPVKDELKEFVHSIKDGKAPTVSGRDGLKALVLANQIRQRLGQKTVI